MNGHPGQPTASPIPRENENLFGSTQAGGGAITIDALPSVDVFLSTCLGGSGDTCQGGTAIYIGTEPGFKEAEADEPNFPLFQLVDGVPMSLEVMAIDPVVSLSFGAVTLSAVGQSVAIGTTPGIHQDLEWQVTVPPGGSATGHHVSVRLTTTSSMYGASATYTFELTPSAGSPP